MRSDIRRFAIALAVATLFVGWSGRGVDAQQKPPQPPIASGAQGKIVLIQGHVDSAKSTNQNQWDPAQLFQPLYVSDRVRTLTASRSAILFIDETQVKLNAGAVLSVQQIKTAAGTSTTLSLLEGEGWFRTKNPASGLTIKTPRAAAAIRGTEINIVVRGNDAVLTVTEGAAELSNDAGAIVVNAGEEATATPGQVPTKRTLLNPEDAVQWVLYYPTRMAWHDLPAAAQAGPARAGFDRLRSGDAVGALAAFQPTVATDPWSRVGAAIAHRQLGDPTQARTVLSGATLAGDAEIARRAELAAAALAIGDARTARAELDAAIASAPEALRPLVMLSELELTQNRKAEAAALARKAVAAHPDSVAAHVASAEAAQAAFDLNAARRELDAALAIDPDDLRALVDRARIRFGVGDTAGARQDADRAATRSPDDAQLRSLLGFVKLAGGEDAAARADFEAAVGGDAALGEPHLGLGLLDFRAALSDEGLLEMLTATLLEPKVSLYQSYLGKAYYQLKRFPEGLAALSSAKRLDPRDPTPWLYASFFLRDLNRQVDALDELKHAIGLNDNRAVYRSRLLLDRDLATKNVSLAKLYNQLGFDAWGAYEALNSLNTDLTNASAHLFMADSYLNLPDRSQAVSSELDQYFLYSPVNLNSFNNFSEYTSLLERPLNQVTVTQSGGNLSYSDTTFRTQSGNERLAHVAFVTYHRQDGARPDRGDEYGQAFGQLKLAFGPATDLFLAGTVSRKAQGKDPDEPVLIGQFPIQVNVAEITLKRDATFDRGKDVSQGTLGLKHLWTPGSAFTLKADLQSFRVDELNPDASFTACTDNELNNTIGVLFGTTDLSVIDGSSRASTATTFRNVGVQAQQATRLGRHQILAGGDLAHTRKTFGCQDRVTSRSLTGTFVDDQDFRSMERSGGVYLRDDVEVARWLHVTAGARYVNGLYQDPLKSTPDVTYSRLNPSAGMSVRVSPTTLVHVAVFRNTNDNFFSSRVAPPTVAGFVVERNELPAANRDEAGLAIQKTWSQAFLEVRGFVRHVTADAFRTTVESLTPDLLDLAPHLGLTPAGLAARMTPPDADFKAQGLAAAFNRILTRQVSLFLDEQFSHHDSPVLESDDNVLGAGVNYIHPRGVFARVSTQWLKQRHYNTLVVGLPDGSFLLTNAEASYEFAGKRGVLRWRAANLFNRSFRAVIENLSVEQPLPFRTVSVSLRWRL